MENIKVICYGTAERWTSRKNAIAYYEEAAMATAGSAESARYCNILSDLMAGKDICSDAESNERISYQFDKKEGNKWVTTFVSNDPSYVYERLTNELIAKKINNAPYIRSIKRTNLYNGYQKITATYRNDGFPDGRGTYIIKN